MKLSATEKQADFGERFVRHFRRLWLIALGQIRLGSGYRHQRAEEIVQESAMIAMAKLDQFDATQDDGAFLAWMTRIIQLTAKNEGRYEQRRQGLVFDEVMEGSTSSHARAKSAEGVPMPEMLFDVETVGADSEDLAEVGSLAAKESTMRAVKATTFDVGGDTAVVAKHVDDEMLRAIESIEHPARTCLLLKVVDEMSYREIATVLEIEVNTAMSHVHRAKRKLRQMLSPQVVTGVDSDIEVSPGQDAGGLI